MQLVWYRSALEFGIFYIPNGQVWHEIHHMAWVCSCLAEPIDLRNGGRWAYHILESGQLIVYGKRTSRLGQPFSASPLRVLWGSQMLTVLLRSQNISPPWTSLACCDLASFFGDSYRDARLYGARFSKIVLRSLPVLPIDGILPGRYCIVRSSVL